MKMHSIFAISILLGCSLGLQAQEKPWTPDMDYNTDRRLSAGDPDVSPWKFSTETRRAEYGMLYLLQAHKDAILLSGKLRSKVGEGKITQEQIFQLRRIGANLDEVLKSSYGEVTPHFSCKKNPTLLLMMLYHYEVYGPGGDSESWPTIIKPLQDLDPEITAKAKELAKKGTAGRNKVTK